MRPRFPLVVLVVLVVLMALVRPAPADAAEEPPDVKLEVFPAAVDLPIRTAPQDVVVVARNPSAEPLEQVRLSWTRVDAAVVPDLPNQPAEVASVPSRAEQTWTLRLSPEDGRSRAGTLLLRLDYTWRRDGQDTPVSRVVFGTLQVRLREPELVEKVVAVEVKTGPATLNERRPGTVYLVVTNKLPRPITLRRPEFTAPRCGDAPCVSITGDPRFEQPSQQTQQQTPQGAVTIGPYGTVVLANRVEVNRRGVTPGKHLVLFNLPVQWEGQHADQEANLVATHTIELGVFGEAEFLAPLALASFYLLPGFIMVTTFGFFFGRLKTDIQNQIQLLRPANPEFWLAAIVVSLLFGFVYPMATGFLTGARHDYLDAYNTVDVAIIGWLSFGIPFVGFVLYGTYASGKARKEEQARLERTPSATDSPVALLRKLRRQGLGTELQPVRVKPEDAPGFLLERLEPDLAARTHLWVGPGIEVTTFVSTLSDQIDGLLTPTADAAALANIIDAGEQRGECEVKWKEGWPKPGPYYAPQEEVRRLGGTSRMVNNTYQVPESGGAAPGGAAPS